MFFCFLCSACGASPDHWFSYLGKGNRSEDVRQLFNATAIIYCPSNAGEKRQWLKVRTQQLNEVFLSPDGSCAGRPLQLHQAQGQSKTPNSSQHLFFLLRKKENQRHTSV